MTDPAIRVILLPRDTNAQGSIFGGVILSHIDLAGARCFLSLHSELEKRGIALRLVEARSKVRDMLRLEGVETKVGRIDRFTTLAEAIDDLASLRVHVEQDDPAAARRVAFHIIRNVEMLLPENPEMGRPGRVPGTRELVIADVPTYSVVYRVTETEVRITRIWHGRQRRGRH